MLLQRKPKKTPIGAKLDPVALSVYQQLPAKVRKLFNEDVSQTAMLEAALKWMWLSLDDGSITRDDLFGDEELEMPGL